MSAKVPVVTPKQAAHVARRLGFELRRHKGSHAIYVRPANGSRVVIPMHTGVDLKRKTLRGIIEDLQISVEEFVKLV